MKSHQIKSSMLLPRPIEEVFSFFSKAENLNAITPPELNFTILTPPPIHMEVGTLIDYSIRLHGIPMKWKTLISKWEPPFMFVDQQLKGPYKIWIHEHTFRSIGSSTEMNDIVQYLSPGWLLEPFVTRFFVKRQVEKIFEFRQQKLKELFK